MSGSLFESTSLKNQQTDFLQVKFIRKGNVLIEFCTLFHHDMTSGSHAIAINLSRVHAL
jgi:hypothetical protein